MIAALLLQILEPATPTITLGEAMAMSPAALASRLLPDREYRPVVDSIINGRGLSPPSLTVDRVWIVEQMVPFDDNTCRSHVYQLELTTTDPKAKQHVQAVPTRPVKIAEYDRLWAPPSGPASVAACAAAPSNASGFSDGGLGLEQASALVMQAKTYFRARRNFKIKCRGNRKVCGVNPRKTLASLDWSLLGLVEQVMADGEPYYFGGPEPVPTGWGPTHVQFTFPYAADGDTWVITVDRKPHIAAVRMEAQMIIYH